jgi:thioredoxin 1
MLFNKELDDLLAGHIPVLVDFYADWCVPCKWVLPVLDDIEKHFNGKIILHKIDIDTHTEIAKSLSILSVPTLILFKEKKEVWRMRGFDLPPILIKSISSHL